MYISDAGLAMAGRERGYEISESDKDGEEYSLIHKDDVPVVQKSKDTIIASPVGVTVDDDRPIRLYDGEKYIWVERRQSKISIATGEVFYLCSVSDVHERELSRLNLEKLSRQNEEVAQDLQVKMAENAQYLELFNRNKQPRVVYEVNEDMKIVFANESWFNVNRSILTVTSLADVLGRSRRDVFIPKYWENVAKNQDENSLPYLLDMPHNTKIIRQVT